MVEITLGQIFPLDAFLSFRIPRKRRGEPEKLSGAELRRASRAA
jgi:hypothetical protein